MLVALTFALAYAATNLDNMALFIALAPSFGLLRVGAAFLLTQASVIAAAFGVGTAIDALPLEWIGWFGLVPIALGLRELWKLWGPGAEGGDQPKVLRSSGLAALLVTFGGLSFDSFALTAALLADSTPAVDLQVLLGAFLGLASICLFSVVGTRVARRATIVVQKLYYITPFVMIAAGLYIIADSATDLI